jgi:thiol-disulfide isomerase/thioredoxin
MKSWRCGLLILPLLWLGGCGKKEETPKRTPPSPSVNSERNLTVSPVSTEEGNRSSPSPATSAAERPLRFAIRDIDRRESTIEFEGSKVLFRKIRQPIVMVTLFADWCPPCRGLLPYLGKLQQENREELFLIGILVHSDLDDDALRRFMLRYDANFFMSNHPDSDRLGDYLARRYELGEDYPLPLTLVFKNGKYLMHIDGAAPFEMLQNLVDQLKKKTRKE